MPFKSGKEKFTKEEIIDILKRNVSLYKDEKEFVDYIVNLAMFLMDQYYERLEEERRSGDGIALFDLTKKDDEQEQSSGGPQSPSHKPKPPEGPRAPVINKALSQNTPISFPQPPSKSPNDFSVDREVDPMEEFLRNAPPKPFGHSEKEPEQPEKPARPFFKDDPTPPSLRARRQEEKPPEPEEKPRYDVNVSPLSTPDPEDRKPRPPKEGEDEKKFDVIDKGRTRVYRVVRSYKSQSTIEIPCPVCGASVPGESKRCPTCGHLM